VADHEAARADRLGQRPVGLEQVVSLEGRRLVRDLVGRAAHGT
jgi:hypothetical protein